MAFRRDVLLEIGGFDPLFGAGSLFAAEDVDAAGRASAMGWRGQYRPEVVVNHHHGRKASDAARLSKSYHIGRGAYHMKLLLNERQYFSFVRAILSLPRRMRWGLIAVYWEMVGASRYAFTYITQLLSCQLPRA
jgi:GT2 family glycosyltransferase